MPGIAPVLDRILLDADSRKPYFVERRVVRPAPAPAAGRPRADHPQVPKRRQDVSQNLTCFRRTEHLDAASAAGAGVDVEVATKRRMLGVRLLGGAEVLFHIRLGPKQPLLLAAPQGHTDRTTGLDPKGGENAGRLHHHGDTDRVVGGTGGRMPRVEVPT